MKKFASVAVAVLLVALMAFSCVGTAFAATEVDTSQKGEISLTKKDSDGQPVAEATFAAYRILDFDGKTYTVNDSFSGQVDVSDIVNTDASQAGTLSYGSTDALEAQISKLQDYIKNNSIAATATDTSDTDGKIALSELELGVYLVQETKVPEGYMVTTQAFLVAVPTWAQETESWVYSVEATPKDELLQVDKKMKDENQGTFTDGTQEDSYSIGDTIPYTVTAKIPNYGLSSDNPAITVTDNLLVNTVFGEKTARIAKYNALNLEFTDILSKGLTLDLSSLEIKVLDAGEGGADVTLAKGDTLADLADFTLSSDEKSVESKTSVTGGGDYTAKEEAVTDGNKMTVAVAWNSIDQYQGKTIQLTYNAQLNDAAVVGAENRNDVTYKFTNDPQKATGTPDDTSKTTTTDTDRVYTYAMNLNKTFNGVTAPEGVDPAKVEFELYVKSTDGGAAASTSPLYVIKNESGNYTIWTGATEDVGGVKKAVDIVESQKAGTKAYVGDVVTALNPDSDGALYVDGFEAGTYELKETKSVDGYTILTEPVTILVEEVTEGTPAVVTGKVTAYTMAWSDAENKAVAKDKLAESEETGVFKITVNNAKNQFNLPITGGLGLWMFTIGGGIVMAGAIIFFAMLRKKKTNKA